MTGKDLTIHTGGIVPDQAPATVGETAQPGGDFDLLRKAPAPKASISIKNTMVVPSDFRDHLGDILGDRFPVRIRDAMKVAIAHQADQLRREAMFGAMRHIHVPNRDLADLTRDQVHALLQHNGVMDHTGYTYEVPAGPPVGTRRVRPREISPMTVSGRMTSDRVTDDIETWDGQRWVLEGGPERWVGMDFADPAVESYTATRRYDPALGRNVDTPNRPNPVKRAVDSLPPLDLTPAPAAPALPKPKS